MKKYFAGVFVFSFVVGASAVIGAGSNAPEPVFDEATVHITPDCACCEVHADYLEHNGVSVDIVEHAEEDLLAVKEDHGIPSDVMSCHTTEIDEHVVEGHVPIQVINAVKTDFPDVTTVSLPGMPHGAPGMPGWSTDHTYVGIDKDGNAGEFIS